ncbi:MAG: penicillin-insensitive murein endopeptidase [Sandaracinaceae bacterium]|nr:penicillin-insensitive murein endopeptidase [Sandaracinaceae bacterium]
MAFLLLGGSERPKRRWEEEVEERIERLDPRVSTSIGGPTTGRLKGGIPLPRRAFGLFSNPERPNPTAFYGTVEMIRALVRAGRKVAERFPQSLLYVNDISLRRGGPIPHHASHRAGRDVDLLFYLTDMDGQPITPKAIPIDPDGIGIDFGDPHRSDDNRRVRFDGPRNWRLIQVLLENREAKVQRIFVAEHIRTLLLQEAVRAKAPRALVERFEDVSCQPATPHDDHFHIRLFCSDEDLRLGCADAPPIYPWRLEELRKAGMEPVYEKRRRRRRFNPIHPPLPPQREVEADLLAFMERRRSWSSKPHPGRPYCP